MEHPFKISTYVRGIADGVTNELRVSGVAVIMDRRRHRDTDIHHSCKIEGVDDSKHRGQLARAWHYCRATALSKTSVLEIQAFIEPDQSGYRDCQVYVGDYVPVSHEFVPSMMQEYHDWLMSPDEGGVIHAAIAHCWFTNIHPFVDGNGRTGRLITNRILNHYYLQNMHLRYGDRQKYYEALQPANHNELDEFVLFVCDKLWRQKNGN